MLNRHLHQTPRSLNVNQEKALAGAFSVITNLRMELFEALSSIAGEDQIGAAAAGLGLITGHGSDDD